MVRAEIYIDISVETGTHMHTVEVKQKILFCFKLKTLVFKFWPHILLPIEEQSERKRLALKVQLPNFEYSNNNNSDQMEGQCIC